MELTRHSAAVSSRSNDRALERGCLPLSLQVEQMSFSIQAAGKAGQLSRRSNDTMTRHDDRYWIFAVCGADCSCCTRITELLGKLAVTSGLSKRYGEQGIPHVFLKTSPPHIKIN